MSSDFDVAVAGGGIAGLTAGLRAAQLGRRTLVLTGHQFGGNLLSIERIDGHPDYPDGIAGYELLPSIQAEAAEAGAEFSAVELDRLEGTGGGWTLTTGDGQLSAGTVILATGAGPRGLDVPGEDALAGRGVSHCASCDAPLLRDKVAVVIGGGDSALQESLTLADSVAKVVIVQAAGALTGQSMYVERVAKRPTVEILLGTTVAAILGDARVTGVRLATGEDIACDAVFVYVGLAPQTAYMDGLLALDSTGRVPTDQAMATSLPGLFAAGLVRAGSPGRAAISANEARTAAEAADRWLRSGG